MSSAVWAQQNAQLGDEVIEEVVEDYYEEDEVIPYEEDAYYAADDTEPELRHVDAKEWQRLKEDKRFQYKDKKKPKPKKEKKYKKPMFSGLSKFFNSSVFKIILFTLLGAFLILIIYLFIKNNNISFSRNVKDEEIEQEAPWEDVKRFEDWELALQKAIADQDYRLATRIYYLHTLNILNKNGHLQYREDKTNWYYVHKLYGSNYHDSFKELTRSFDYIWYGEYQISKDQFDALATLFKNFKIEIQ